jgi:hypothetical protein
MELSSITGAFQAALHYRVSPGTEGLLWKALMGLQGHRFHRGILRIRGYPVAQLAHDILVLYILLFQCKKNNRRFPEKESLYIFQGN